MLLTFLLTLSWHMQYSAFSIKLYYTNSQTSTQLPLKMGGNHRHSSLYTRGNDSMERPQGHPDLNGHVVKDRKPSRRRERTEEPP